MAKIKAVITVIYEVPDDHGERLRAYGTADLVEMAKYDEANAREDPEAFLGLGDATTTVRVEPVE